MTFLLILILAAADLSGIKATPDLEKRSELALANADEEIDNARAAYKSGSVKKMQQALEDLRESVAVAADALENHPKQARKSKYYKRAELKTRAMLRRLTTLADEVSVDDRKPVDDVRQKVQEIHDHLLEDIMSNKK